jgi:hypothetical protein
MMSEPANSERLESKDPRSSQPSQAAREVRIRLPRAVIAELKRIADVDGTTMNAIVARYIDMGFKSDGRPGVFELAAWFKDYLRRKGGRDSGAANTVDQKEDFT